MAAQGVPRPPSDVRWQVQGAEPPPRLQLAPVRLRVLGPSPGRALP
jgi:hypothetical protein